MLTLGRDDDLIEQELVRLPPMAGKQALQRGRRQSLVAAPLLHMAASEEAGGWVNPA